MPDRRIVAGLETIDGRKRELIVHAGVIDAKRGGKEAIADDFVGDALIEGNEHYREPWQARAPKTDRHENSPQLLSRESMSAADGRQVHVSCGGARAWVFEPTRAARILSVGSSHETRW